MNNKDNVYMCKNKIARIDILIDREKKKQLKIALAKDEKTITNFILECIDKYLDDK